MPERGEPRSPHLFISYASVDRDRVLPVVDTLRNAGLDIWIDQDDIVGGTVYAAEIAAGIEGCLAIAVMCSSASLTSHNVRQEIALAWKYRRPYLPLLLEPVTIPRDLEYWLEGSQWIELFDQPTDQWLPRVSQALERLQGSSRAPAATVSYNTPLFDVPAPLTAIVGRELEMRTIAGLLYTARLATLTGPGGTGKTRVALAVAHALRERFDGDIVFVDLSPVHDPSLVIPTIAGRLGVQSMGGQPIASALMQALSRREVLLVLDNFEQVIDAAVELSTLLAGCPGLRILATSRTPLRVEGEQEYPIAPLSLPNPDLDTDAETLGNSDAVQMFVERAKAIRPTFRLTDENAATVASICIQLDGLPLAIELAAARIRMLAPETLLQRLEHRLPLLTGGRRDLPARQQTLRDTIAWSHDLLQPEDQILFRRLGVFVGGWTLEAAEHVAGEDIDVLISLDSLISHSLVRADETGDLPRFTMLETIREFSLEQLSETGEEVAIRERHADWVRAFVEEVGPQTKGPQLIAAMNRLDAERANIRAALDWFINQQDAESGWRIAGPLWLFWWMRNHLREAHQLFERLLSLPRDTVESTTLALGLTSAGIIHEWLDDVDVASELQHDALKLWETVPFDLRFGEHWAHACLGNLAMRRGDFEEVKRHARMIEADAQERGDEYFSAMAKILAGNMAGLTGNVSEAESNYRAAVEHARRSGDPWAISLAIGNVANTMMERGEFADLEASIDELIAINRDMAHVYQLIWSLGLRSELAVWHDRPHEALEDARQSLALAKRFGNAYTEAEVLQSVGNVLARLGRTEDALAHYRECIELIREHGSPNIVASALDNIAILFHSTGEQHRATRLAAAATAVRASYGVERSRAEQEAFDRLRDALTAELSESEYAVESAVGMALSMDDAITYALENS